VVDCDLIGHAAAPEDADRHEHAVSYRSHLLAAHHLRSFVLYRGYSLPFVTSLIVCIPAAGRL